MTRVRSARAALIGAFLVLFSVLQPRPPVAGADQETDDQRVLKALVDVEEYSRNQVEQARQKYLKAKERLLESCPTLELLDTWNSELQAFEADRSFPLIPEFADDAAGFDRVRGFHAIAMTDLLYKARGLASRRKWPVTYRHCNARLFREKDAFGKPKMAVLPGGHASAYSLLDRSMNCTFYQVGGNDNTLRQASEPLRVSKNADGSIGFEWNNDEFRPLLPANKGRKQFNDIFGRTEGHQNFILGDRDDNSRWKQFHDIEGKEFVYLSYYSPFGGDLDRVRVFGKVSVMALVWSNPEFEGVFNELLTVLKDESGVAAIDAEVKMTKSFGD